MDDSFWKPSAKKGLISYIVIYLGVSSMIAIFIAFIIGIFSDRYSILQMINMLQTPENEILGTDISMYYKFNTYVNFFTYLISFIVVGFFMRDTIVMDFEEVKRRKIFHILFAVIGAIVFWWISILVSYLISNLVGESENQNMIVGMINNNGEIPIFLAVVVFAPFVEELVYRKCIFKLLEKCPIIISYLVSTVVFVLPHMISTPMTNIINWLLLCVPYFVSAVLLCLIYHKSNKNLYVVWFVHMINNLISFILIILG